MAKKGKNSQYVSNGVHSNVSKSTLKDVRREIPNVIRSKNKWDAFAKGKRVMVTIPNPNAKSETNKPFIRITAQEAGWKKPERYHMKT